MRSPRFAANHSQRRVLIVDDSSVVADTLAVLVRHLGHRVKVAYTGAEALRLAEDFEPHAIVSDLAMPEMDGFELAQRLLQNGCRAKLVALTAFAQPEFRDRADRAGFETLLLKPATAEQIQSVLSVTAARRRGTRAHGSDND